MAGFLDTIRFFIIIVDVLSCVRKKTKKYALARVGLELDISITRRTTPNPTAKVPHALEVVFAAKSSLNTRTVHTSTGVGIEQTKSVIKAVGPKSYI